MRFARVVFLIAGIWGVLVVTPLYFLFDLIGRQYPPPITHPDFYYGFASVTLAWQVAFLVIASNPLRLRPMIPVAILEKFGYVTSLGVLYARGQFASRSGRSRWSRPFTRFTSHRSISQDTRVRARSTTLLNDARAPSRAPRTRRRR